MLLPIRCSYHPCHAVKLLSGKQQYQTRIDSERASIRAVHRDYPQKRIVGSVLEQLVIAGRHGRMTGFSGLIVN